MFYKRVILYRNLSCHIGIINHGCFCVKCCISLYCLLMLDTFKSPHKVKMPSGSSELSVCDNMVAKSLDFIY